MPRWNLETDIAWDAFDPARLDSDILKLVKAAALTEYNAARYTAYLHNVFKDDPEFQAFAKSWQEEEEQHGRALGRYAEVADPTFDFPAAFKKFTEGYVIPVDVDGSVRGSRVGEMVARCVVETGTSSYYTAMSEATDEPVLQQLCRNIAGDEYRHYKLFLDTLRKYQPTEHLSVVERIRVAISRLRETNDDELAYAFHCANEPLDAPYDRVKASAAYGSRVFRIYQHHHVERATGMVMKAAGLKPQGWLGRQATRFAWWKMQVQAQRVAGHA
ncbi:MAG TPA: ferritin-like domain-containing protein [Magnetospirillaceae bacterium]|jgi:rubrerythrin